MANIQNELNNIKNALFGKEVRGSIHDGIDAINKEVESTTSRQVDLESTFDQLVINAGNSNAEIVDARVKADGTSYTKLGDRLNAIDSQLEHVENKRDKNIKINNTDLDTSEDSVKIKLINLSNEVKEAITGSTPITSEVDNFSINREKINKINTDVLTEKIVKSKNLFNKNDVKVGYAINDENGKITSNSNYFVTNFIEVYSNTKYYSNIGKAYLYDVEGNFLTSIVCNDDYSFATVAGAKYFRAYGDKNLINNYILSKDTFYKDGKLQVDEYIYQLDGLELSELKENKLIKKTHTTDYVMMDTVDKVIYEESETGNGIKVTLKGNANYENSFFVYDYENKYIGKKKLLNDVEFIIPSWSYLVYDVLKHEIKVISGESETLENKIILLGVSFKKFASCGVLNSKLIKKDNYLYPNIDVVGNYFDNIIKKESEVIKEAKENNFIFGLMTDIHVAEMYEGYKTHTCTLMNRFNKTLSLDCIMNAGDTIRWGKHNKYKSISELNHFKDKLNTDNFIHCIGNHDYNGISDVANGRQYEDWTITLEETYQILGRHLKNVVWGSKKDMYFYKDFEDKKIRVIVLNTCDTGQEWITDHNNNKYLKLDPLMVDGCRQTQLEWLTNIALNFESKSNKKEWHTMILTHVGLYSDGEGLTWNFGKVENDKAIRKIINSFRNGTNETITYIDTTYNTFNTNINTNFTEQGSMTFIGIFSGHNHLDRMVNSDNGLINISTTCGYPSPLAAENDGVDRTIGTYNEFACDVVIIDKENRKIKMKRFGGGTDRYYSY